MKEHLVHTLSLICNHVQLVIVVLLVVIHPKDQPLVLLVLRVPRLQHVPLLVLFANLARSPVLLDLLLARLVEKDPMHLKKAALPAQTAVMAHILAKWERPLALHACIVTLEVTVGKELDPAQRALKTLINLTEDPVNATTVHWVYVHILLEPPILFNVPRLPVCNKYNENFIDEVVENHRMSSTCRISYLLH